MALKYYIGVLPHGVPYSVWVSEKFIKNNPKKLFLEEFGFSDLGQSKKNTDIFYKEKFGKVG